MGSLDNVVRVWRPDDGMLSMGVEGEMVKVDFDAEVNPLVDAESVMSIAVRKKMLLSIKISGEDEDVTHEYTK